MHWKTMFRGVYLAAVEFEGRVPTFTITGVKMAALEQENGTQKDKGIVTFSETDRGWVLCKTSAMCVAAMFGDDTQGWIGKRVTLFEMMVAVGKEMKPGIRVKGSPDITEPMSVDIKLPRKKPFKMNLVPTVSKSGSLTQPPVEG